MTRRPKWELTNGYTVIAIPDSGLFVRDGRIQTGHGTEVVVDELILFSRRVDADRHADQQVKRWAGGVGHHEWSFPVVPVLISERK